MTFDNFFDGSGRPDWAGGVEIAMEQFAPRRVLSAERHLAYVPRSNLRRRATRVTGLVLPVTTKGRPSPPKPSSGLGLEQTLYDKGHLMALELGGPDIAANIVPQWRNTNENGTWRLLERELKEMALKAMGLGAPLAPANWKKTKRPPHGLKLTVDVVYGREPTVPARFEVRAEKVLLSVAGSLEESRWTIENEPTGPDLSTKQRTRRRRRKLARDLRKRAVGIERGTKHGKRQHQL